MSDDHSKWASLFSFQPRFGHMDLVWKENKMAAFGEREEE